MTKIEAIIQPSRFQALKAVLLVGIEGMTISHVRGHGRQKGYTEVYRGCEYTVDLLPKVKLEIMLSDHLVEATVGAILNGGNNRKNRRRQNLSDKNRRSHPHPQPGALPGAALGKIKLSSSVANSNLRDKINFITVA